MCVGCGAASAEVDSRVEAEQWALEHGKSLECLADVIIQLRCRMPGGGDGWFFG